MREGLLVINKEPGPTSFDLVRQLKRKLPQIKVGHTGSLDPFASGVMILLTGKATKLSQALLNADKSYEAVITLGKATDTLDSTGKVTEEKEVPPLEESQIKKAMESFLGTWNQIPPMYSAKKHQGVRLYKLARENIKLELKPVPVQIYRMELLSWESPVIRLEVHCSKGTYVRALADELGKRLGTVAYLHELKRLTCGDYSLSESVKMNELLEDIEISMTKGFDNYRKFLSRERHLQFGGDSGMRGRT